MADSPARALDSGADSDTESGGAPATPQPPPARRLRLPRSPEVLIPAVTLAMFALYIIIRLAGSLLGFEVFAGADLLSARPPWNDGGTPVVSVNPLVGDTIDSLIPSYLETHARLWDGDFAWWSGDSGPGTPLLASTNLGMVTPLTAWLAIFPPSWSLGLLKLLQLLTAFAGMTLWLRRVDVARGPAMVGALAYCGTGFFVGWRIGCWIGWVRAG